MDKHETDSVSSGYPNTDKRVDNTTDNGVFLTRSIFDKIRGVWIADEVFDISF